MPAPPEKICLEITNEDAMTTLGRHLAGHLSAGDAVFLRGPIGAGKTHLARAIIQGLIGHEEEVPSPTYTLVQTYEAADQVIWHADLYRLSEASELVELGLDDAFGDGIVIVEWPDRLPPELHPANAIDIEIHPAGESRNVEISARPEELRRLTADFTDA